MYQGRCYGDNDGQLCVSVILVNDVRNFFLFADDSNETRVYEYLASSDDPMKLVIPAFHNRTEWNGETFLEIEDLLTGFDHNPAVMDLKIGCRTFLESEVTNSSARNDLYKKVRCTLTQF